MIQAMRPERVVPIFVLASLLGSLDGCKDDANKTPAPTPSAASASAAPQASAPAPSADAPKPLMVRGGGQAGLLLMATRSVELKDDQKAKIEAIAEPFKGGDPLKDDAKALHTELVAEVKAGKIENAKLEPLLAALEKAAKEQHDKENNALDALYAALEPAQRAKMVAQVRSRNEAREAAMKAQGGPDGGARPLVDGMAAKWIERLTKPLDLDAAQQAKVTALVPKPDPKKADEEHLERKKQTDALLAAFEKEGFDAKKLPALDPKKARAPFQEHIKLLTQLIAILKPEQREKLATGMSNSPRGGPFGPSFGGHGGPGGPGSHGGHGGFMKHGRPGGPSGGAEEP